MMNRPWTLFLLSAVIATIAFTACSSDNVESCTADKQSKLYLSVSKTTEVADGTKGITIQLSGTDQNCKILPAGTVVQFSLTSPDPIGVGQFSNADTSISEIFGAYSASTTVTSTLAGTVTVGATVSSPQLTSNTEALTFTELPQTGSCNLTVAAEPSSVIADGSNQVTITATVTGDDGDPLPDGAQVSFSTDLGKFGANTDTTSNVASGQASAVLTSSVVTSSSTAVVSVSVKCNDQQQSTLNADLNVPFLVASPTINLSSSASRVNGDGTSTVDLTAVLLNSDGSLAASGVEVTFTTDLGSFQGGVTTLRVDSDGSGEASATFLGGINGGTAQIEASATIEGMDTDSTPQSIDVLGLDDVSLSASTNEVLADGESTVDLTAIVTLSDGSQAWEGMTVEFLTTAGSFQDGTGSTYQTTTDAEGRTTAVFISGTSAGTALISVTASVLTKEVTDQTSIDQRALEGVVLVCTPIEVLADGVSQSECKATAYVANQVPVEEGEEVTFSLLPSSGKGEFFESEASTYLTTTDSSGSATATYVAGVSGGPVTVTATVEVGQVKSDSAVINLHELNSIQHESSEYERLGALGSGRNETSRIVFKVLDTTGVPMPAGCPVDFSLSTAPGIPTINPTSTVTNEFGMVWTTLRAGRVATSVTITAKAYTPDPTGGPVPIKTAEVTTTSLAIVGAKPNAGEMGFYCETDEINRPGFSCYSVDTNCTARLGDRFSNFIGMATSVNFYTEAGWIMASAMTVETEGADLGKAMTLASTNPQDPPLDVPPFDVPLVSEPSQDLGDRIGNPRDGLVTILATTTGEEYFNDLSGDGYYDLGEPFVDLGEPFIDSNDNGEHDPGEFFIDSTGPLGTPDGIYTEPNGEWDSDTVIWTSTWIMWSKAVYGGSVEPNPFSVALDSQIDLSYRFWDENYNRVNGRDTKATAVLSSNSVGKINTSLSIPGLPATFNEKVSIGISMEKVKSTDHALPCCVSIVPTVCDELDEICHLTPVISSYDCGAGGSIRLEGEDPDTTDLTDPGADVIVTVDHKMCPDDSTTYTSMYSATGEIVACEISSCAGDCDASSNCGASCEDLLCDSSESCYFGFCCDDENCTDCADGTSGCGADCDDILCAENEHCNTDTKECEED